MSGRFLEQLQKSTDKIEKKRKIKAKVTQKEKRKKEKRRKHTTPGYSPVVTDPTTSQAIGSLSRGERTGSRVFAYHL